jgi:hypothetical protein
MDQIAAQPVVRAQPKGRSSNFLDIDVFGTRAAGDERVTHARTHDRGRFLRQFLLVPAAVTALMTVAAPAAASPFTGPLRAANSARTAAVVKKPAHARHLSPRFREFGRKVG